MPRRSPPPPRPRSPSATAADARPGRDVDPGAEFEALWGERLRRAALGLTAALVVARAYWPGEGTREETSGAGSLWVFAVLLTLGVAVAAPLVGGRTRLRWSRADGAVYLLMALVGLSAMRGAERRVAINLAWEWVGVGVAYALVRHLPRTRAESSTLAGVMMATAVAVSAYGLYQNVVELPAARAYYESHERDVLKMVGIAPGSAEQGLYKARLFDSNEPNATFALANSLAGVLVGPAALGLAVGLEAIRRRDGRRPVLLALGALPWLTILACLMLTKSRSAYLGLLAASLVLAWRLRVGLSARAIGLAGIGLAAVLAAMATVGVATRKLDVEILTESTKSLRYRLDYWRGAWDIIRREPGAWWGGVGPGNFSGAYLRYKKPWASEEVSDPHNLLLDAWATAGVAAAAALATALGLGLREIFGPGPDPEIGPEKEPPPSRSGWLVAFASGGWLLAWPLGGLDPFSEGGDLLARWAVLGLAWGWAVLFGAPIWRRAPTPAAGLGAAALAVAINLLAAGGIGFAPVALGLWTAIALGQNLRDDRPCGRLRDVGGRGTAFTLAAGTAALIGAFYGAISPAWKADAAMAETELDSRRPDFSKAMDAAERARQADRYAVRPYLTLAELEYRAWQARGSLAADAAWLRVDTALLQALTPPRNPRSLLVRRREADYAREFLHRHGHALPRRATTWLRNRVVDALTHAVPLYPNSALLRAEYAEALGEIDREGDAIRQAEEALRLDGLTPHIDKSLPDRTRERLRAELSRWKADTRRAR